MAIPNMIWIGLGLWTLERGAGVKGMQVPRDCKSCGLPFLKMNVLGLMAIPPNDNNTDQYFKSLSEQNSSLGLEELSMGMSSDYENAIKYKATYLRIGSLIFGSRT